MTKQEVLNHYLQGIKWSTHRPEIKGGQHAGIPNYGVKLTHEELGFEISTDGIRSQYQAKQFCMTVFELFLHEIGIR